MSRCGRENNTVERPCDLEINVVRVIAYKQISDVQNLPKLMAISQKKKCKTHEGFKFSAVLIRHDNANCNFRQKASGTDTHTYRFYIILSTSVILFVLSSTHGTEFYWNHFAPLEWKLHECKAYWKSSTNGL